MNAHNKGDLQQMQSLPLDAKIIMSKRRIRDWYDYWHGDVYVSFSGGKDSTVLKHLVDEMYDDVPAVFVNTGLEYPEIQQFVKEVKAGKHECFNPDVEILRPEMRFDEVIQRYGYPVVSKAVSRTIYYARLSVAQGKQNIYTKQLEGTAIDRQGRLSLFNKKKWSYLLDAPFEMSDACCEVMKKRPVHQYEKRTGRKPIIGTMAYESAARKANWLNRGCNAYEGRKARSAPLSFWTEQDVLHYIKRFSVPYCLVYGEIRVKRTSSEIEGQTNLIDCLGNYHPEDMFETTGCDRTGCMFCMFGCHLEKEPNRFQRMKKTHTKQHAYCMDKLGLKKVLEYIGVPYE